MIKRIRHKGLRRYFESGDGRGLPANHLMKIRLILSVLDSVSRIESINLPNCRLHGLKGDRKGDWSLTVKSNWLITFKFDGEDVTEVDYEDYH